LPQVNSALAVLAATSHGSSSPPGPARPLALLSIKGYYGHAEAGAGAAEAVEAVAALQALAAPRLVNLRALSPLLEGPLEAAGRPVLLPRGGPAGLAAAGGEAALWGVSSL
jgi:3-oxoacyl-(acyl-carrier-protein) synthase